MAGGGGGPSSTTVEQTSLPDYAEPYFTRIMERGEALSLAPYQAYGGKRIADRSADTLGSQGLTRDIVRTGVAGLPQAMQASAYAMGAGQGIAEGTSPYQFGDAQRWIDPGVSEAYMSPYMRNVLDVQKDQARRQYNEQRGQRNSAAVQAGAFGGSRQAVMEGVAERALLDRMSDIEAQGMQQAYQTGMQGFQADRGATLAQMQAQAAENRGAVDQQLGALGFMGQQAGALAGFGELGRAADIQNAQLLEALGQSQEAYAQRGLDLAYEDFLRQQAYPEQQLQLMSSILRGVPVEPTVTQIGYEPYNPLQQALGAGIGAVGLYRGLVG